MHNQRGTYQVLPGYTLSTLTCIMNWRRLTLIIGFLGYGLCLSKAEESNLFPGIVSFTRPGQSQISWNAFGPFLFNEPSAEGGRIFGLRPLFVQHLDLGGSHEETTIFYPLFYYRSYGDSYEWSIFKLINSTGRSKDAKNDSGGLTTTFDVWPVYFSEKGNDEATSSMAVFPLYGKLQGHLGLENAEFIAFPLYLKFATEESQTTYLPWPFIRFTTGKEHGFSLWPLFGTTEKPDAYKRTFALWPFIYSNEETHKPDEAKPAEVSHECGVLPFYSVEKKPGYINENYLWPFFGYSDRTSPIRYHETRYFWPLLVQGRGDEAYVNRFGPIYTHSVIKGLDKTWYIWPLYRQEKWADADLGQEKTRVLFFLISKDEQFSVSHPEKSHAVKTTIWPLVSTWDNGAGQAQTQILSPFEGIFADSPQMRYAWAPIFSFIRFEQASVGETRLSLAWNAITWAESNKSKQTEFHLGPLIQIRTNQTTKQVAFLDGLFGFKQDTFKGWSIFGMEFSQNDPTVTTTHN